MVKIVTNKNGTETSNKNFILKSSAKIRHHVIDKSSGHIHLGLTLCRAIDHLYIVQCYHVKVITLWLGTVLNNIGFLCGATVQVSTKLKPAGRKLKRASTAYETKLKLTNIITHRRQAALASSEKNYP